MAEQAIPAISERPDGLIPTTRVTNELTRAVLAMAPAMPHGGSGGSGIASSFDLWLVWDAGPGGEADFTDHRYWLRRSYLANPANDAASNAAELTEIGTIAGDITAGDWIAATNEAERPPNTGASTSPGTHSLLKGQAVGPVWVQFDASSPQTARYVFVAGIPGGGDTPGIIAFGTANADWPQYPSDANQIDLTPCAGLHDTTPTGNPVVTAYIVSPPEIAPGTAWIQTGDVIAYIPVGVDEGVIINVAQGGGLVKLTSAMSGGGQGGWYNGSILAVPAAVPDGSTTVTESQVGQDPGSDNAIVCNLAELGQASHIIKFSGTPTPYQNVFPIAALLGYSGGVPVVAIWAGGTRGITDSPTTLGASTEGSDSANTATWTWDPAAPTAVAMWIVTDVVYSDAGDQKLYAMKRKLTFDTQGFLYSVSGETRVLVDTPST